MLFGVLQGCLLMISEISLKTEETQADQDYSAHVWPDEKVG